MGSRSIGNRNKKKGLHATCSGASSVTLRHQCRTVPLDGQSFLSFLYLNTMRAVNVPRRNTDEPRNPHYEQDIVHILKHTSWILRSIGIWPTFLEDGNGIIAKLLIGLCNLILLFAVIPFSLYITVEEKNITMKLKLIGLLSFCVVSLMKYWALTACKPRLKHCVEDLENDWKQVERDEDRELMLKYGNVGRRLTMLCLGFMYSGGFMYHTVLQFVSGTYVDDRNRTIKPLVYPTYSGMYNPQESPVYEMVYTVHCMCGYVIYSVTVGACGLAATFASHICGQIDVMILRLKNLVDLENKTERDQRLIQIVEHHIRTLRFSATVETLLQEVCFVEFIGSTFMICLLEYYILMTVNVGLSCFLMDWYKFPTDTIRALIMIIARSSSPAKISAGQIVVLNLSTFGSILKTSLGYLSLLRTVI
ncbi:odorant receptor 4-like isoform X2 [Nomia melanderi]|uniref:odorant receptor 4-like isoform X2 n=1 Tax=Nomia melanderi TaxID=2448451 RepID=UPI003FCD623F